MEGVVMRKLLGLIGGVLVGAGILAGSAPGQAQDEASKAITQAQKAYQQKDYMEAITRLQIALQEIERLVIEQLEEFLPESPPGWKAEKTKGGSAQGMGIFAATVVSRRYSREKGDQSIEVQIAINSPLVATFRAWLANPLIMSMMEGSRVTTLGDYKCIEKVDQEAETAELNVLPGSAMLVTIRGENMRDPKILYEFARRIRLAELEKRFE